MLDATQTAPRYPVPLVHAVPRTVPRVLSALVAVVAALGVHLVWAVFVATEAGQRVDQLALTGAQHGQYRLWTLAEPVLDVVSVAFVVAGIVVAMTVALARRRWALALQVAVLVGGANATTQLLKKLVYDRPHLLPGWSGPNTLPSGHTTVAASVALALLLVVPRAWRPVVAVLGALWTAAMGVSTLVGQWHRPSDVVAALLVTLAWAAAVCVFGSRSSLDVARPGAGMPLRGSLATAGLLVLGAAGAGVGALVALGDLHGGGRGVPFSGEVTAYTGGVAGVVAVTAAAFAAMLLLRQATARPGPT
ncbi:phosphatase PAP2 family protein [Xylanimonas allomyrinae]|uniref:Phosphatase PAP2 family protein n=1 Tax=Xylanimonas allomyrinae TaxID=2509459 RepID=A0A4P6F1N9_9MICO|nr:phosphatase PAP2 family protein [Xylanimonas allomyrinae]QAY64248.1 phosphatase PAP2 family protein [Xylanimonas allomyrinae]